MDLNSPDLTGLYTEPENLRELLSLDQWRALKRSGVLSIEADAMMGGVTFDTRHSGLPISGSSQGYVLIYEEPKEALFTQNLMETRRSLLREGKRKFALVQRIDEPFGVYFWCY